MSAGGPIRFGVLGCSRIAQKAAVPAIAGSRFAEIAIIGSRSPARARACAAPFGCAAGTYDDVLAHDIDAVYISLPNSMHEEWALKAAAAGRHVWCEKPAALGGESAEAMVEAAKRRGVRLMEGFMFLHHPQHARAMELIASGAIGEVTGFEGRFAYPRPAAGSNLLNRELGGGTLNDALVYPIRASRMILGAEPGSVSCRVEIDPASGVEGSAEAELSYPDGIVAKVSSGFDPDYRSTYRVLGTAGSVTMGRAYAVPADMPVTLFLAAGGVRREIHVEAADQFRLMVDDFAREVASGSRTKDYETDLLSQARIVGAARVSSREHRAVRLGAA